MLWTNKLDRLPSGKAFEDSPNICLGKGPTIIAENSTVPNVIKLFTALIYECL